MRIGLRLRLVLSVSVRVWLRLGFHLLLLDVLVHQYSKVTVSLPYRAMQGGQHTQ